MTAKEICIAAVPGLFESGGAIWEDGGERDALAYTGCSWANVRKFDKRVLKYVKAHPTVAPEAHKE